MKKKSTEPIVCYGLDFFFLNFWYVLLIQHCADGMITMKTSPTAKTDGDDSTEQPRTGFCLYNKTKTGTLAG